MVWHNTAGPLLSILGWQHPRSRSQARSKKSPLRMSNPPEPSRLNLIPRLRTHSFEGGTVAYDPETRTTLYLPDPTGRLLTLLAAQRGTAMTTEDILQALTKDSDPLAQHPDQLDALLRELQERHLVAASE